MGNYISGLGATESAFVPTRLQDGDTLASLAALYQVAAKVITDANGVPLEGGAISGPGGWVATHGGKVLTFTSGANKGKPVPLTLPSGKVLPQQFVFTGSSVILLPVGGQRSPVGGGVGPVGPNPGSGGDVSEAGTNPVVVVLGVGALVALFLAGRKKKSKGSAITKWSTAS